MRSRPVPAKIAAGSMPKDRLSFAGSDAALAQERHQPVGHGAARRVHVDADLDRG